MSLVERQVWRRPLGAVPVGPDAVAFRVWAPRARAVEARVDGELHLLKPMADGVHEADVPARPGDDYSLVLDGEQEWPDPWSRWQPEGVRGFSRVLELEPPRDGPALQLRDLVVYELHVGTFTPEGTFDAVTRRLRDLRELGVTAIELMPVATFPGDRGWGYDGLYTSAPHPAYGGPEGFARLVDAAHSEGLGVLLDVVYNHIGPGNEALTAFAPYFTDRWGQTPWGDVLDYSERGVREWAIQSAELWIREYRVDGLRLDAVHAIEDDSEQHVLAELAERVRAINPHALVISEMGRPDFRPLEEWGHDAMWLDELHHRLHVALTGEQDGYYAAYDGSLEAIASELHRPHAARIVAAAQNHDQIGNRALGDRLPPDKLRVAAAVVLFSRFTPLLFQGEEHAEPNPFLFFTDHVDPAIADATRDGRRREFAGFAGFAGEVPDPQARETFERSRLSQGDPEHRALYERLLALRPELPDELEARVDGRRLVVTRGPHRLVADFDALTVELA